MTNPTSTQLIAFLHRQRVLLADHRGVAKGAAKQERLLLVSNTRQRAARTITPPPTTGQAPRLSLRWCWLSMGGHRSRRTSERVKYAAKSTFTATARDLRAARPRTGPSHVKPESICVRLARSRAVGSVSIGIATAEASKGLAPKLDRKTEKHVVAARAARLEQPQSGHRRREKQANDRKGDVRGQNRHGGERHHERQAFMARRPSHSARRTGMGILDHRRPRLESGRLQGGASQRHEEQGG
jgi:hypothetical protein